MTPLAHPHRVPPAAPPCPAVLSGLDADVCHLCQRLAQLIDPQEFAFVCEHERQPPRRSPDRSDGGPDAHLS